mmetsp:Transcript_7540/g.10674  ORF Transcript_7540/g.10674 Transcript_7540/m.10674 type:complete len:299 (+) Transcript_7540:43-939(+)
MIEKYNLPSLESLKGRKVAIFGLSANPPTNLFGHTGIVRYLVQSHLFAEIWVLPVYQHMYIAKRNLESFEHRMKMCSLCMERESTPNCCVRVLPLEKNVYDHLSKTRSDLVRTGTIDILDFISLAYGGSLELHLVLGSDTYSDLANFKWKESARILSTVRQVHVINRALCLPVDNTQKSNNLEFKFNNNPENTPAVLQHHVPWLSSISSTHVRSLKPFPLSIWPFTSLFDQLYRCVHPEVYSYMKKHRLYGFSNCFWASKVQPWNVLAVLALSTTAISLITSNLWTKTSSNTFISRID